MIEACEHGTLAANSIRQAPIGPFGVGNLERDLALDPPVGTIRQPHGCHAALSQLPHQPIRPDAVAGLVLIVGEFTVKCCERGWRSVRCPDPP